MKNIRQSKNILATSAAALLALCILPTAAQAGQTWDGGGANDNWTTIVNWTGDVLPDFTQPIIFNGLVRPTPNQDNAAGFAVNGITFGGGAAAFTLNGNLINLASGGITNSSAATQTFGTMDVTLGGANTIDASSANITFNAGAPILLNGFVLTLRGVNTITFNTSIDAVASVGGLIINGSGLQDGVGTVAVNSPVNNLYTGGTAVNNGLVTLGGLASTQLGTGTLTIGDGIGAQGTAIVRLITFSEELSNAQNVLIDSDGRLDLNGFNETVGNIASTGATQANSQIFKGAAGTLTTGNATNTSFQGVISGAGTITKQGTGVWTLTGANTYTGVWNVNAGTLAIGDVNSGGGSGSTVATSGTSLINVGAAGTLRWDLADGQTEFNNMGLTVGSVVNATPAALVSQTLAGLITGAGTFNQNGPGLTILTFTNTFAGPVNVLAGQLSVGDASTGAVHNFATVGALANIVTVNGGVGGANLFVDLRPNETFSNRVILTGAADTLTGASPFAQTVSSLITGLGSVIENDVANTGATTMTNVANTYSGGTTITSGTLNINALSAAAGGVAPVAGPIGTGRLLIVGGSIGTTTAGGGANNWAIGNLVTISGSFGVSNIVGAPVLAAAPPAGVPNGAVGVPVINTVASGLVSDGHVFTNTTTLTVPVTITTNSGFLDFSGTITDLGGGFGLTFAGNTFTYLGSAGLQAVNGGPIAQINGQVDASNAYTGLTTLNGTPGGSLLLLGKNGGAIAIRGNLQVDAGATVQFDSGAPGVLGNQIVPTANALINGTLDTAGLSQALNKLTGAGTVRLDDSVYNGAPPTAAGILTVNSGVFSGAIVDAGFGGQLVKNTPGVLNLTGASTYVGKTTVNGGSLLVNGSIASANTFVNALGLLGGSGFIKGNVFNSGVVSPGNSPGTLTIGGSYTQTAAGTLLIEVAGRKAGQFDVLAVGGAANLNGTVRILNTGSVHLKRNQTVTFLTAGGGVNGKFSNEIVAGFSGGTLLKEHVAYKTNSVQLTMRLGSFASDIGGLTENQNAVARSLDKVNNASQASKLLNFLSEQQIGKLPAQLDRIAPEELASFFNIGMSLANVQNANLERRMADIQAGATGFNANGYGVGTSGPSYSGDASYNSGRTSYGARGPEGRGGKELAPPLENRVGAFITGVGEFTNIGNTANAQGYDLTTGGFTLGVDFKVTPNFTVGINAGYARTGADLTDNGRVTVDGAKGGIYATYFTGTGFYVDAAASGGYNSYDSRRSAVKGTASGTTTGAEFNALLATGYDWKSSSGLSFGPVASVQYTSVGINSFREHGSLAPLNFKDQSEHSLRTALGMKMSYDIHPLASGVVIRPEVRAAWQHEFGDSSYALESRFASGAGSSFTVHSPEIGDDSLLVGAGVAVLWNERTSTYVFYDGELLRSNYSSNNVSGGVRLSF